MTSHDDPCFPGGQGREVLASDFGHAFERFVPPSTRTESVWMFRDQVLDQQDLAREVELLYTLQVDALAMP